MLKRQTRAIQQWNNCRRCSGTSVETYADLLSPGSSGEDVMWWRCVNCGEYMDQQVLLNRSAQGLASAVPFGLVQNKQLPRHDRPILIQRQPVAA